jgi:formylglycine-generating enzyme required for sulfatase activity
MMGASPDDSEAKPNEKPAHEVFISKAFYLGRTPVTQAQWHATMGSNPSDFAMRPDSPVRPVERVSWDMIQDFNSATGFRLPTEAEWEYACRAGSSTPRYGVLNDIAWYEYYSGETHAVATKLPNALGLYDMLGNVFEWCRDIETNYPTASMVNPIGAITGSRRLLRGGSWGGGASDHRGHIHSASGRIAFNPDYGGYDDIGFRAVRNP